MTKLAIFDLDGTLVEDHLVDKPCDRCEGRGVEHIGSGSKFQTLPCRRCFGKTTILVPRRDIAYIEPRVIPGVADRLGELSESGASFAIATNQGGVALGFQTVMEVNQRIASALRQLHFFYGASFSVHYCLDHPQATIEKFKNPSPARLLRRKPEPGMLLEAISAHRIEAPSKVLVFGIEKKVCFVGDRSSDEQAALAAGVAYCDIHDWLARGNDALAR